MSTNYFGYASSDYAVLDGVAGGGYYLREEQVHLGQRAIGWEFMFQGDRSRGVTGIQSWLRSLNTFSRIEDEYGHRLSVDEFLDVVESHRGLKKRQDGYPPEYDFLVDDGCFFAFYEFS